MVLVAIGLFNWLVLRRPYEIPTDWYWPSTRVIPGTINEFPYFTFLYADLHAHMIALPFTLLALAAAANPLPAEPAALTAAVRLAEPRLDFAVPLALPRPRLQLPERARARAQPAAWSVPDGAIQLVVAGLAVGALLPINSWDFPTYLGLVSVAGLAPWYLRERRDLARWSPRSPASRSWRCSATRSTCRSTARFVSFYRQRPAGRRAVAARCCTC